MFSVITNIYNKETKGPTLVEFFTAPGTLFFSPPPQIEMFAVCTTGDTAHIDTIFKELEYRIDVCLVTRGAHIEHL